MSRLHKLWFLSLLTGTILFFEPRLGFDSPVGPSSAFAATAESDYQEARKSYYRLLGSSALMAKRIEWEKSIRKFQKVERSYPKTKRAADALYSIGLLYKRLASWSGSSNDLESSVASFREVVRRFPGSSLVDDAHRNIGDMKFREDNHAAAEEEYRKALDSESRRSKPESARKRAGASKRVGSSATGSGIARLEDIVEFRRGDRARIILSLSRQAPYRDRILNSPARLYIDLLSTRLTPKALASGEKLSIRMGKRSENLSRVVFDLADEGAAYNVMDLKNPFRILVDINERASSAIGGASPGARTRASRSAIFFRAPPVKRRAGVIVIDPGHGGRDPGAIGRAGLKEKDVVLKIALELEKELKKKTSRKIVLTRRTDKYLSLDERALIANALNAELFVSIHLNASRDRRANGFETYFLSPARSKDELETAARENMMAIKSSNEFENDLAYIMSDLSNTSKVNDSYMLAQMVHRKAIERYGSSRDRGVKQAMFYVLWGAEMPSILVESGFISNSDEERALRSSRSTRQIAGAISDGIVRYLDRTLSASR